MKLRTKLILAFLALSIVPLTGLVAFSYYNSVRVLRQAVEEQSRDLAEQIEVSMEIARAELLRNWQGLRAFDHSMSGPEDFEATVAQAMDELGPWASLVRRWEFQPHSPPAPSSLERGDDEPPELAPARPWREPRVVMVQPAEGSQPSANGQQRTWRFSMDAEASESGLLLPPARPALERASARLSERLETLERELQEREAVARREAEAVASGRGDVHAAADAAVAAGAVAVDLERLRDRSRMLSTVLEREFRSESREIGTLDVEIDQELFLRSVLRTTPHERGEIAFAIDPQGEVYFRDEEDRRRMLSVSGLGESDFVNVCREGLWQDQGWVLATRQESQSGFVYGIARPIDESLDEIQRTTGRNFLMGVGLIGLSLFGILPLSSRLTRGLQDLSDEVERLSRGERVGGAKVRGRDELAQLANSFNDMAEQLDTQRSKLVEQELTQRLLEAENARRRDELDDARCFQLGLLPKSLPQCAGLDVAVLVRTATEVGGDYYDFFVDSGEQNVSKDLGVTVAVGDATGHGARAGTMVAAIKALLSGSPPKTDLGDFLGHASRVIKGMGVERMAMSLQLVRLHEDFFDLASAGMPPALLWRSSIGRLEELVLEGLPLGGLAHAEYDCLRCEWEPGDVLLMMSDGLLEQMQVDGTLVGYQQLREVMESAMRAEGDLSARGLLRHLEHKVEIATGGSPPGDDVTFVAIRRCPL